MRTGSRRFGAKCRIMLPTAAISDALDSLGIPGTPLGLGPLWFGCRFSGRAFTVRYRPADPLPGTVGDFIDDVPPGGVVVIDNAGRLDCTVWGDIMTGVAHARGIAGTVIDGVCRDVAKSHELKYPILSRGRFMRTGKDRVQVESINEAVTIGGVRVVPGDLIVANDDGVVIVPREHEAVVLERAHAIDARENAILASVAGGMRLVDARAQHGYHELQRPSAEPR